MRSVIHWIVGNSPMVNTMMVAVMIVGFWAGATLRRQIFPDFQLDMILISVPYPGASPSEVEEGICQKIEESIRSVDGIKKITGVAQEGFGYVIAELRSDVKDPQKTLNDIRSRVDQIPSFPDLSEDPDIRQVDMKLPAVRLAVHGGQVPPEGLTTEQQREWRRRQEIQLRDLAEKVRDELLLLDTISTVDLDAARDYQIDVEIPERNLRRHGLTLRQVAGRIRNHNIELPAGDIRTDASEYLVRGKNKRLVGEEIAELPLLTRPDGAVLRVKDLGNVHDGFTDDTLYSEVMIHDGNGGLTESRPAISMIIQKATNEDMLAIADEVREYIAQVQLPEGYELTLFNDNSVIVLDRLRTLTTNGLLGLVLVFLVLGLFLELRLAFWVALGIPVSLAGACMILLGTGLTMDMIAMFAFLLALGIVVDDAIVVGENIYRHRELGKPFKQAAIDGTMEVMLPVLTSVMTTVIAFAPLLFVFGVMGKIIYVMPVVVISMLAVSLIESFFVLPNHLAHGDPNVKHRSAPITRWLSPLRVLVALPRWIFGPTVSLIVTGIRKVQRKVEWGLQSFINRIYEPLLGRSLTYPAVFLSLSVAGLLASAGLVSGGFTPFVLFPKIDSNFIHATIRFPSGTTAATTEEATNRIANVLTELQDEFRRSGPPPIELVLRTVGQAQQMDARQDRNDGANIGQVFVELKPTEERNVTSDQIIARWREIVGSVAGAEELRYAAADMGPGGIPIEFKLTGKDMSQIEAAVAKLKTRLESYDGVFDIADDSQPGKPELQLRVKPSAESLGIDTAELAQTVRSAFYGEEVMRLQRGRHEVKLMVRYPLDERDSLTHLEEIRVRTAQAGEVPLLELAQVDVERGYSEINRIDQRRSITITADVDENIANTREIVADLQKNILPGILAEYPDLRVRWEGQQQESAESMGSLFFGFGLAVFMMYALLTMQFRSYLQPIFILMIIPFGVIGAVLGHLFMGLPLTIFSMFGLVALSGVLVNDSIVLIDFINARLREGMPIQEALITAGRQRFRPVLLTSLTTIAGLLPILSEKSLQVQVIIPMATSLAFGLMLATVWVLFLVPTLYSVYARLFMADSLEWVPELDVDEHSSDRVDGHSPLGQSSRPKAPLAAPPASRPVTASPSDPNRERSA